MKLIIALAISLVYHAAAVAQPADPPRPVVPACPPDVKGNPPVVGSPAPNLSDKLGDSKGVICPPAGIDPDSTVRPPSTNDRNVVPAPGTPGGDQSVQPK